MKFSDGATYWKSQFGADAWVISLLNRKRGGYFVEVGAFDGVFGSNTYSLEKEFGWRGLCIEPGRSFVELKQHRSCSVDSSVVYSRSGVKVAYRVDDRNQTCNGILDHFNRTRQRRGILERRVTRSLNDLLTRHHAPFSIDFMSIDTEGSELEVLKGLDFSKYRVTVFAIEHNIEEPKREQIREYLEARGFLRARAVDIDDWYVNRAVISRGRIFRHEFWSTGPGPRFWALQLASLLCPPPLRKRLKRPLTGSCACP